MLASPALLAGWPAAAQGSEVAALRQGLAAAARGAWTEALGAANGHTLVAKMLRWLALVTGPTEPDDAAVFLAANPDWPLAETIRRRGEAILAASGSDAAAARWFATFAPLSPAFRIRLAGQLPRDQAAAQARTGWVELPPDAQAEAQALARIGPLLSAADHAARFDRQAWAGNAAAAQRLLPLLPPGYAASARAQLDLLAGRDAPDGDPANANIFLRRARLLRQADRDAEALSWWRRAPAVTEPERAAAIWNERQAMARRTLRLGDAPAARRLAAAHGLAGGAEAHLDAQFVTGWLGLRFNDDAAGAARAFTALSASAVAPISVARGAYWQGRAAAAQGQDAAPFFRAAAEHPATYYGQLAVLELGEGEAGITQRLATLPQPAPEPAAMRAFLSRELARAARLWEAAGERGRSRQFLLRLEQLSPDPAGRAHTAALATVLGRHDVAIAIARRVGPRDGATLLEAGWPAPFTPPPGIERALALALIRQESSFDADAVSPVGARGLMQLMPATARTTARRLGVPTTPQRLTADPQHNMALGTAYLAEQLGAFDGAVPLALAAYNAGPHRVAQWLAEAGDPRIAAAQGGADPIDWVERIPFAETRNYVQRVIESQLVYRARFNEMARHPLLAMAA